MMSQRLRPLRSRIASIVLALSFALSASAQNTAAPRTDDVPVLNISVAAFSPGVPSDASVYRDMGIFPRIREIEAKFLPFVLREALARRNEWGAVRVVPDKNFPAELLISGSIIESDGDELSLQVHAVDSSGRVWIDQVYTDIFTEAYEAKGRDAEKIGYSRIYDQIGDDLMAARKMLDDKAVRDIVALSLLRYAANLAPSAFGEYIREERDGRFSIRRLPAVDDPMVDRIDRIRRTEYVITDTVDEKFRELYAEIASVYDIWRGYRRKFVEYQVDDARRAASIRSSATRGTFDDLVNIYDSYKWDRMAAQEQDRLAIAFNNEVGPTVDAMEARIEELEGWVDEKYVEWNRLLEELFDAESELFLR